MLIEINTQFGNIFKQNNTMEYDWYNNVAIQLQLYAQQKHIDEHAVISFYCNDGCTFVIQAFRSYLIIIDIKYVMSLQICNIEPHTFLKLSFS